jgi:hypothetical protein
MDLANLLKGWGQLKANESGWPMLGSKFVNYRETYDSVVSDDLAAKTPKEK